MLTVTGGISRRTTTRLVVSVALAFSTWGGVSACSDDFGACETTRTCAALKTPDGGEDARSTSGGSQGDGGSGTVEGSGGTPASSGGAVEGSGGEPASGAGGAPGTAGYDAGEPG